VGACGIRPCFGRLPDFGGSLYLDCFFLMTAAGLRKPMRTRSPSANLARPKRESSVWRILLCFVLMVLFSGASAVERRPSLGEVSAALANSSPAKPADFEGVDLSYLDLSGLNFQHANLRGANLTAPIYPIAIFPMPTFPMLIWTTLSSSAQILPAPTCPT
jgi:hypothetical protein